MDLMARRAVLVVLLVGCAYALLARIVLHGPVGPRSLQVSVEHESGSGAGLLGDDAQRCERARQPGEWTCRVPARNGSGGAAYRVRVARGSSCWTGTLEEDDSEMGDMPKHLKGCVRRWQWRVLDVL
jgi:hypothetical protein